MEKLTDVLEKSAGLHVLVVDDEPLIRWSIAETLQRLGWVVSEAGDARETLQRLADGEMPDVIVLDYRLPDSDDLKLLASVRRTTPRSPVILMTAYGTAELSTEAGRLGAFRVIGKPFEMRELADLVREAHRSRAS